MCVKLPPGDLNPSLYLTRPTSTYTCGVTIAPKVCGAESLGLPYLNAFLDAVGSNFTHGVNFATAGSSILPQTTTLKQSGFSPISPDVQWAQFNDFHRRTQIFRQKESIFQELLPKPELFSRALYTIDIGQNDLTSSLFLNKSTDQVKAVIPVIMDQFKNIVKERSFWIHNTGPVGCLAYVLVRLPVKAAQLDRFGCATAFNGLAQHFNSQFKEAVVQLRKDLPLAAFTYVDVYSVKAWGSKGKLEIDTALTGRFKESLKTCCGYGGKLNYDKDVVCGKTKKVNGREVLVAANKYVFDQIVGGSFSDPPIPVKLACHRH
ncbi:hypothetical protein RGQ29_024836 [Quercus rubra]|uniref:GDSL esterase/lipase n=1 Tax=Quercus rubra TaxID=3512 RepID=A0AAN7IPT0_QUERU|nr:hypothetical protein RGQ29_024836 [Quercus rubra]